MVSGGPYICRKVHKSVTGFVVRGVEALVLAEVDGVNEHNGGIPRYGPT